MLHFHLRVRKVHMSRGISVEARTEATTGALEWKQLGTGRKDWQQWLVVLWVGSSGPECGKTPRKCGSKLLFLAPLSVKMHQKKKKTFDDRSGSNSS